METLLGRYFLKQQNKGQSSKKAPIFFFLFTCRELPRQYCWLPPTWKDYGRVVPYIPQHFCYWFAKFDRQTWDLPWQRVILWPPTPQKCLCRWLSPLGQLYHLRLYTRLPIYRRELFSSITQHKREFTSLVAKGLTNAEIGALSRKSSTE